MPVVRVSFIEGRSEQQKDRLAEAIADAMHEFAGSRKEGVNVIYEDVAKGNWYIGGKPTARAASS
jgi:4-oxalocrotonate tautomerase